MSPLTQNKRTLWLHWATGRSGIPAKARSTDKADEVAQDFDSFLAKLADKARTRCFLHSLVVHVHAGIAFVHTSSC